MEEVLDVARYGMNARGQALQELARANRAEEMYGNEFKAMREEYEKRVEEKVAKKEKKRVRAEETE
jgi:hypothetical protein